MVMGMKHEFITKDYALYIVRHFAAMKTWSKKEIIGEILRKIGETKEDVVRCKNCKHFGGHGACNYHAADENGTPIFVREDDFCSYGERKKR